VVINVENATFTVIKEHEQQGSQQHLLQTFMNKLSSSHNYEQVFGYDP
jgi:hypothetical protein